MTGIYAKVICDSVSPQGIRLTTMEVKMHKFILGEFTRHRMFSVSFQSSRAIPTAKLLEQVRNDPAMPVFWGSNQPGMQAGEELQGVHRDMVEKSWRLAACETADVAQALTNGGLHKQIANRVLEPFMYTTGVVTATEWDNFFGLRLDKAAQPEMRALAVAMWEARQASTPRLMQPNGNWHLPYFRPEDWCHTEDQHKTDEEIDRWMTAPGVIPGSGSYAKDCAIKVSVARCARVSYKPFDADRPSTFEEDLALYDKLVGAQPIHASPAEHQATPDTTYGSETHFQNSKHMPGGGWSRPEQHGNFRGWRQYRKMLPGEAVAPLPEEYR